MSEILCTCRTDTRRELFPVDHQGMDWEWRTFTVHYECENCKLVKKLGREALKKLQTEGG